MNVQVKFEKSLSFWHTLSSSKWAQLRKIENVRVIKSMYIWLVVVPILVKALSRINEIISVTIFQYTFEIPTSLPFSWQFFFFSALAFVAANLIFVARCPRIIKDYVDLGSFESDGKGVSHLYRYWMDAGYSNEQLRMIIEQVDLQGTFARTDEEKVKRHFWDVFNSANSSAPISRVFCSFFYVVGFFLITIVLVQNVITVIAFMTS